MTVQEQLYIKYIKTTDLRRILDNIQNADVLKLVATRSFSNENDRKPLPNIPYMTLNEMTVKKVKIDFNSLKDGAFNPSHVLDILHVLDNEPLNIGVNELHVELVDNKTVGRMLADEMNNDLFLDKRYVAVFKSYPVSREGECNQFVQQISNFRSAQEKASAGYKMHSLDFKYVLELQRWREMVKMSNTTKEYKEAVKAWTLTLSQCSTKLIREIVEYIFPKPFTSGRVYRKGAVKGKWILSECGREL